MWALSTYQTVPYTSYITEKSNCMPCFWSDNYRSHISGCLLHLYLDVNVPTFTSILLGLLIYLNLTFGCLLNLCLHLYIDACYTYTFICMLATPTSLTGCSLDINLLTVPTSGWTIPEHPNSHLKQRVLKYWENKLFIPLLKPHAFFGNISLVFTHKTNQM